ncbi:hypothetical protein NZ698_00435 [Chryseobacterium sp. PBS4-4]|uniref:Uncharacterized protein n=1 Tax=Chryseobacterium edaphi TaxID=2976532 RepID=A0ABT2W330_9FLAO|nr:hypothetical protein [Chryseobacterium edaphi]MCU7615647.1 hypothetical protein [Chryseobacterium edaphi]
MKNIFLLLLFSGFALGQNVELIQKFDNGDENTPTFFATKIIPEYKLIKTKKIDSVYGDQIYFIYLPKKTSDENITLYLQNNLDSEAVTLSYRAYGSTLKFNSIKAKCSIILPFWITEIKPDTKIVEGQRNSFIYDNPEIKVKYYLTTTETDYKNCSVSKIK